MRIVQSLLAVVSALICGGTNSAYGFDDEASKQGNLYEALRVLISARTMENSGNLEQAAINYENALSFALCSFSPSSYRTATLGSESLSSLARRTLYLNLQSLKSPGTLSERSPQARIGEIKSLYRVLEKLEPDNPSWWYLDGELLAAAGNYLSANAKLQKCVSLSSSEAETKAKAQALLNHIKPGYEKQLKWEEARWKAWLAYMQSGKFHRDVCDNFAAMKDTPYSPPKESSSDSDKYKQLPEYERRARDAEYQGDYGAASRYRSGGNTCADDAKYW